MPVKCLTLNGKQLYLHLRHVAAIQSKSDIQLLIKLHVHKYGV